MEQADFENMLDAFSRREFRLLVSMERYRTRTQNDIGTIDEEWK